MLRRGCSAPRQRAGDDRTGRRAGVWARAALAIASRQ